MKQLVSFLDNDWHQLEETSGRVSGRRNRSIIQNDKSIRTANEFLPCCSHYVHFLSDQS